MAALKQESIEEAVIWSVTGSPCKREPVGCLLGVTIFATISVGIGVFSGFSVLG